MTTLFGILGTPGPWEMMIVLGLGVLLFGRRLPEVGRSLGRSLVEFKKGLNDVAEESSRETVASSNTTSRSVEAVVTGTSATKFEASPADADKS
ncbi:MAG: Sec-independent protein translocase subunit TatA/TatB [Thermoguttaceae bacterium]